jgi:hypothetical protein
MKSWGSPDPLQIVIVNPDPLQEVIEDPDP